jgi:hypothetical protein
MRASRASVGPRSSGEVAQQHASGWEIIAIESV